MYAVGAADHERDTRVAVALPTSNPFRQLSGGHLVAVLVEDDGTEIIFVYLESIRDGRRLMEVAKRSPKPILVMKSNIGQLGQNIAASHTASLSSDDRVVDAAFKQCGITRVHDVTTLSQYMKTLRLPPLRNTRLAIISRSGGHAIVAAARMAESGQLVTLGITPAFASTGYGYIRRADRLEAARARSASVGRRRVRLPDLWSDEHDARTRRVARAPAHRHRRRRHPKMVAGNRQQRAT